MKLLNGPPGNVLAKVRLPCARMGFDAQIGTANGWDWGSDGKNTAADNREVRVRTW